MKPEDAMTPNETREYLLEEDLRRALKWRKYAPTIREHWQASELVANLEAKIETPRNLTNARQTLL